MDVNRSQLNFIAATLSGFASFVSFIHAVRNRDSVLPGLLGTVGSAAWAMAAWQEMQEDPTQGAEAALA